MKNLLMLLTIISLNVSAKDIKPTRDDIKLDVIGEIMSKSEWVYDTQINELKFCFNISSNDKVCSSIPDRYIIINVANKPSV